MAGPTPARNLTAVPEATNDERDAVARILSGDKVAWNNYMHDKFQHLRSIARGLLQGSDALAEDAVQLALLRAFTKLESFRTPPGGSLVAAFWAWLCRIVVNSVADVGRQEAKQGGRRDPADIDSLPSGPAQESDVQRADLTITVLDIIEQLTPLQQQIARLLMSGVSMRKVCAHLGITFRTLQAAMEDIRTRMKDVS